MRLYSTLLSLVFPAFVSALEAQSPMQVVPSGRATVEVSIVPVDSAARANTKPSLIRIDYGQPHLRGRRILTDSLVPYDKPWRTGANAATTLTTDVDLVIGGANLPKGKYTLLTLPSRAGWKLIVQKEPAQPPADDAGYNPANDVARIDLRETALPAPVESFTMWLIPTRGTGAPRGQLMLAWGTVGLSTEWSVK
jgi:hypothetical protein